MDRRAKIADVIDRHYDEDDYLPVYDADGEIVSSAAGDAVLKLVTKWLAEAWDRGKHEGQPHHGRETYAPNPYRTN